MNSMYNLYLNVLTQQCAFEPYIKPVHVCCAFLFYQLDTCQCICIWLKMLNFYRSLTMNDLNFWGFPRKCLIFMMPAGCYTIQPSSMLVWRTIHCLCQTLTNWCFVASMSCGHTCIHYNTFNVHVGCLWKRFVMKLRKFTKKLMNSSNWLMTKNKTFLLKYLNNWVPLYQWVELWLSQDLCHNISAVKIYTFVKYNSSLLNAKALSCNSDIYVANLDADVASYLLQAWCTCNSCSTVASAHGICLMLPWCNGLVS